MQRFGITIPFDGVALHEQRDWYAECADLGYTDLWSAEVNGADAFTPLALASVWAPTMRLGTAIVPAFTRGPALIAQSAAALADAAPGRFVMGVGTSSDVIVERWNGIDFDEPYKRTRDVVRFMKAAFTGEKVEGPFDTFESKGFKLTRVPGQAPPILVAALRQGMLRMAGREADGAIINWLSADDVKTVVPEVGDGKEIVARIFVCPFDRDTAHMIARFAIAAYLSVPVYAAFHEWLGRAPLLQGMWAAWKAGDRKAAMEAIPSEVIDDLIVWGDPEQCREHVGRYVANGVTTPALAVLAPPGTDLRPLVRALAPASGG